MENNCQEIKNEKKFCSRYGKVLRTISAALVFCFFLQDFVHAQGGEPLWTRVTDAKAAGKSIDSDSLLKTNLAVPADSGQIRRVTANGKSDIVINIQDAHSKMGAQESIAKILETLVRNYDLNLISLEAASGTVDTALVSSFPLEEARRKTAQYFMNEGKISAGEFYSMIAKEPVKLFGAEDPELYGQNLEAFKTLVDAKPALRKELLALGKAVSALRPLVYSRELAQMQDKKLLHGAGNIKFTEYWDYFSALAGEKGVSLASYPNLKKLSETVELEKEIDFKKATAEREALIDELRGKLSTQDLQKLVLSILQFKQNKLTPGAFHYELSRFAQGQGINPIAHKNIILYSQYVVLYENIDLVAIFEEVERFEHELKEKMFMNVDERALSDLERASSVLMKLLDTSLSSKDYEFYTAHEAACEIDAIRERLSKLEAKYGSDGSSGIDFDLLKKMVPDAREFYELATRRNEVLLQNTLSRMKKENVHVAALITGGFHSEGISELMDQEKLSYLVIMPKFDEKSADRPYLAVITKKPKEFEAQFKGTEFYIAAGTFADIDGIAKQSYGLDAQRQFLETAFAALMVNARLIAASDASSAEFKKSFLDNYKQRGGTLIDEATLAGWLDDLSIRKVTNDTHEVAFGKNLAYTIRTQNGSIISAERSSGAATVTVKATDLALMRENLDKMSEQLERLQAGVTAEIGDTQIDELAAAVEKQAVAGSITPALVEQTARRKGLRLTQLDTDKVLKKAGARLARQKAPAPLVTLEDLKPGMRVMQTLKPQLRKLLNDPANEVANSDVHYSVTEAQSWNAYDIVSNPHIMLLLNLFQALSAKTNEEYQSAMEKVKWPSEQYQDELFGALSKWLELDDARVAFDLALREKSVSFDKAEETVKPEETVEAPKNIDEWTEAFEKAPIISKAPAKTAPAAPVNPSVIRVKALAKDGNKLSVTREDGAPVVGFMIQRNGREVFQQFFPDSLALPLADGLLPEKIKSAPTDSTYRLELDEAGGTIRFIPEKIPGQLVIEQDGKPVPVSKDNTFSMTLPKDWEKTVETPAMKVRRAMAEDRRQLRLRAELKKEAIQILTEPMTDVKTLAAAFEALKKKAADEGYYDRDGKLAKFLDGMLRRRAEELGVLNSLAITLAADEAVDASPDDVLKHIVKNRLWEPTLALLNEYGFEKELTATYMGFFEKTFSAFKQRLLREQAEAEKKFWTVVLDRKNSYDDVIKKIKEFHPYQLNRVYFGRVPAHIRTALDSALTLRQKMEALAKRYSDEATVDSIRLTQDVFEREWNELRESREYKDADGRVAEIPAFFDQSRADAQKAFEGQLGKLRKAEEAKRIPKVTVSNLSISKKNVKTIVIHLASEGIRLKVDRQENGAVKSRSLISFTIEDFDGGNVFTVRSGDYAYEAVFEEVSNRIILMPKESAKNRFKAVERDNKGKERQLGGANDGRIELILTPKLTQKWKALARVSQLSETGYGRVIGEVEQSLREFAEAIDTLRGHAQEIRNGKKLDKKGLKNLAEADALLKEIRGDLEKLAAQWGSIETDKHLGTIEQKLYKLRQIVQRSGILTRSIEEQSNTSTFKSLNEFARRAVGMVDSFYSFRRELKDIQKDVRTYREQLAVDARSVANRARGISPLMTAEINGSAVAVIEAETPQEYKEVDAALEKIERTLVNAAIAVDGSATEKEKYLKDINESREVIDRLRDAVDAVIEADEVIETLEVSTTPVIKLPTAVEREEAVKTPVEPLRRPSVTTGIAGWIKPIVVSIMLMLGMASYYLTANMTTRDNTPPALPRLLAVEKDPRVNLRFPDSGFNVELDAELRQDGPVRGMWVPGAYKAQIAAADALELAGTVNAELGRKGNYSAEVPQLPRDQFNVPLLIRVVNGQPCFIRQDGTAVPVSNPAIAASLDATGKVPNDPQNPFVAADVAGVFDFGVDGRRPVVTLKKGATAPLGLNGQPVTGQPIFRTRDQHGRVYLAYRGGDGSRRSPLPGSAETRGPLQPYNHDTGGKIIVFDTAADAARDTRNLELLRNRIALARTMKDNPNNLVAVAVHDDYTIDVQYRNFDAMPPLVFFLRQADGTVKQYLPTDLTVDQSKEPTEIRILKVDAQGRPVRNPDGTFQTGNRIEFTARGDRELQVAEGARQRAVTRSMGNWATTTSTGIAAGTKSKKVSAARPTVNIRAIAVQTKPLYAILISRTPNGIAEYYEIPTIEAASQGSVRVRRAGLPDVFVHPAAVRILSLSGTTPLKGVFEGESTSTTLLNGRYEFICSTDPRFERLVRTHMSGQVAFADQMAVQRFYDRQTGLPIIDPATRAPKIRVFNYKNTQDVEDLQRLRHAAKIQHNSPVPFFQVRENREDTVVEMNMDARVLAVQVSGDLRQETREFWSNNLRDVRELNRLKDLEDNTNKNPFGFQVAEPGQPADGTWIIFKCYGYEVSENGDIRVFDDPLVMADRLRARDAQETEHAHRFQYVIGNGTVVRWNQLKSTDIVIEIRDPETKSRIFTGSQWQMENLQLKLRIIMGKAHVIGATPKAIVEDMDALQLKRLLSQAEGQVSPALQRLRSRSRASRAFDMMKMSLAGINSADPRVAATVQAQIDLVQKRLSELYDETLARRDLAPRAKEQMLAEIEALCHQVREQNLAIVNGNLMLVEPSLAQVILWISDATDRMQRQMDYENILGPGGVIVTTNGDAKNRVTAMEQMNEAAGGKRITIGIPRITIGIPRELGLRTQARDNDPHEEAAFKEIFQRLYDDEMEKLTKKTPQTRFVFQDPDADKSVIVAALEEYDAYIEQMRKDLTAAEEKLRKAKSEFEDPRPDKGLPSVRDSRKQNRKEWNDKIEAYFEAWVKVQILSRRIRDSETEDPSAFRRQVYVREVKNKAGKVIGHEEVVIVVAPANAEDYLARRRAIAASREAARTAIIEALEKGGMRVSVIEHPEKSAVHVRSDDPAKQHPEFARVEGVIRAKMAQLEALYAQLTAADRQGADTVQIVNQIHALETEFRNNTFVNVLPNRDVEVIEIFGGLADAENNRFDAASFERDSVFGAQDAMNGRVIQVDVKTGKGMVIRDPQRMREHQEKLSKVLSELNEEYLNLCAQRVMNPAPNPARDARIAELAQQLRQRYYDADGLRYYMNAGYSDAIMQLEQMKRDLALQAGPNETVVVALDEQGVFTGHFEIRRNVGGAMQTVKTAGPLAADAKGRPRFKVVDRERGVVEVVTLTTYVRPGEATVRTREAQRLIFVLGKDGRARQAQRTVSSEEFLPESGIPLSSTTRVVLRQANKLEDGPVFKERTVMKDAAGKVKTVQGFVLMQDKYGPGSGALNGQVRFVAMNPVTGEEAIAFYPKEDGKTGEAMVLQAPGQWNVHAFTAAADGSFEIGENKGSVSDIGKMFGNARIYSRRDATGRPVRGFAIDPRGLETISFYYRPRVLPNGTSIAGEAVLELPETAGEKLTDAARARLHIDKNAVVSALLYFDANFNLCGTDGRPINFAADAIPAKSLSVGSGMQISNYPSEIYPGETAPKSIRVVPNLDMDQRLIEARVVDGQGQERAIITQDIMQPDRYYIDFLTSDLANATKNGLPIHVTYAATKNPQGIFTIGERIISTTFMYEAEFDEPKDAFWLFEGGPSVPPSVMALISQIPPAQHAEAKAKLTEALLELRKTKGLETGKLTLQLTATRQEHGASGYIVRLKQDPYGRPVVALTSTHNSNLIIHTQWNGEYPLIGHQFSSNGLNYMIKGDSKTVKASEIVGSAPAPETTAEGAPQYHPLTPEQFALLGLDPSMELIPIHRFMVINGKEIYRDTQYLHKGDRFVRLAATKGSDGNTRFVCWNMPSKAPIAIAPGEIVYNVREGRVTRQTLFHEHRKAQNEFVYRVIGPLTGPEAERNPDLIWVGMDGRIGEVRGVTVNPETGEYVSKHDVHPIVLVTGNDDPIHTYSFEGTGFTRDSKNLKHYSHFKIHLWTDEKGEFGDLVDRQLQPDRKTYIDVPGKPGDIYRVVTEVIGRPDASPSDTLPEIHGSGLVTLVYRNGKLIGRIEGTIIGTSMVFTDNAEGLSTNTGLRERLRNNAFGAPFNNQVRRLVEKVQADKANDITAKTIAREIPVEPARDYVIYGMKVAIALSGLFLVFMGAFATLWRWLHREKKQSRDRASDFDQEFFDKDFAGESGAASARLAAGGPRRIRWTPGQRLEMLTAVSKRTKIPDNVPDEKRPQFIRDYFLGQGFSMKEATVMAKSEKQQKAFLGTDFISQSLPKAPALTDDILEKPGDLLKLIDQQVAKNYGPALVIYSLLGDEALTLDELDEIARYALVTRKKKGAAAWEFILQRAVAQAQAAALKKLTGTDYTAKQKVGIIADLPPTKEANALAYILDKGIMTPEDFNAFALAHNDAGNFTELMQQLLESLVVRPEFERILAHTFGEKFSEETKQQLFQSISSQVLPFIFEQPALLLPLLNKSGKVSSTDLVFNPYPMVKSVEPTTLSELILVKCLQTNPSQSNPKKDGRMLSAGTLSGLWPMVVYVARRMNEAIAKDTMTADQVLDIADRHIGLMGDSLLHELERYRMITERAHWNSVEGQVLESVEIALRKMIGARDRKIIDDQLKAITAALHGRSGASRLIDIIKADLDAGPMTQEKAERLLGTVEISLHRQRLQDLFIDLDIWNLYEFALREEEKAKAEGLPVKPLEQQISDMSGTTWSMDSLRSTMKSGSPDQKIGVTRSLKKTSVELMRIYFPEAVKLDQKKQIGLWALYNKYLRPLFSPVSANMAPALGMTKAGKAVYAASAVAMVSAGSAMIFIWPTTLAFGTFLIVSSVSILPILFMNSGTRAKFFWAVIQAAATSYVYANLIYFLFGTATAIRPEIGLILTGILIFLTTPVTWQSFKHYGLAIRSFFVMHSDTWSDTYRSLTGLRSLNPFPGIGSLFSIRSGMNQMPLGAFIREVTGKTGILYSIIAYTIYFTAPASLGYFTIATLTLVVTMILIRWLLPKFDIAEFWENTFSKWFREFERFEELRAPLLPNGESAAEYFERLVRLLHERYLLDDFEMESWLMALKGDPDGRFVKPRSKQAFDSLYYAFSAISQNRPVADPYAVLQGSSTHVQAGGGELMTHSYLNSMAPGTFNKKRVKGKDVQTSLLGYLAQNLRPEWRNFTERLESNASPAIVAAAEALSKMKEEDPLLEVLAPCGLSAAETDFVIAQLVKWLNEMRPNNDAVASSMARDIAEAHMAVANETAGLEDLRYLAAARRFSLEYGSLLEAYEALRAEVASTPADERDGEDYLEKEAFVRRFPMYDAMVGRKLRGILQDSAVWNDMEGETGGKNIRRVDSIDGAIVPKLEAYRAKLQANDPMLENVQWLLDEMKSFSPSPATKGDARFATIQQWSREFLDWYAKNEGRVSRILAFVAENPDREFLDCAVVKEKLNRMVQSAAFVDKARRSGILLAFHEKSDELLSKFRSSGAKHAHISLNLHAFYGRTVQYDAHVMAEYGQNALRPQWATLNSQIRNPQYAAVNTNMIIWAANDAFPGTKNYAIAQMAWTSDVQRAMRGGSQRAGGSWLRSANSPASLLDYGKYAGIPQTIGAFTPPGEDSSGLLMLQRSAEIYGVFYQGTQIDWFTFRWGRPSLLSESIAVTEMRYAFNVTRFVMDSASLTVFHNPNIPADVKLSHRYLWNHYLISPFAIMLLVLLPALSPISAFAFLNPFTQWVIASFALTQAINAFNFLRHWRTSVNLYQAIFKSLFDIIVAIPFYVSTMPFFFIGVWMASNQMFKFYQTVKDASLESYTDEQKFYERFVTRFYFGKYGLPIVPLVGLIGAGLFSLAITVMTPLGPVILIFYFLASLSFMSGFYSFAAFTDAEGALKGYRYNPILVLKKTAFVVKLLVLHLLRSPKFIRRRLQADALAKAKEAGIHPSEMPESNYPPVPYLIEEMFYLKADAMIAAREKAKRRAEKAAEDLGLPIHEIINASGKTTKELNDWSVSKEIARQVRDGERLSADHAIAASRLSSAKTAAPAEAAGSRLSGWRKAWITAATFVVSFLPIGNQVKSQDFAPASATSKEGPAMVRFLESNLDPRGLPLSFRVPKGYWDSAEYRKEKAEPIEELLLQHSVNTYDLAIRQIVLAANGKWDEVRRIQAFLNSNRWGDLSPIRASPIPFLYGDDKTKLEDDEAFFFRSIASSYDQDNLRYPVGDKRRTEVEGFPTKNRLHHQDWVPTMGESAWLMLAGVQTARMAHPNQPVPLDSPFLQTPLGLLRAMEVMQNAQTGAVYHVPWGTYGKNPNEVSTENNESLFAALVQLLNVVEQNRGEMADQYAKRIRKILYGEKDQRFGAEFTGHKGLIHYFGGDAYDRVNRIFHQGGEIRNGVFMPSNIFAADVQTWAILALGPERIDALHGKGAALALWTATKDRAGYYVDGELRGIGFTTGRNRQSSEWTFGAMFAVHILIDHYSKDPAYAAEVATLGGDIESMSEGMKSLRVELEDGSVAYLYANGRFSIPFGWNANPIPSLAGTNWAELYLLGWEPFSARKIDTTVRRPKVAERPQQPQQQPPAAQKPAEQKPAEQKAPKRDILVSNEWTFTDILVYGGIFGAAGTGILIFVLWRRGNRMKGEWEGQKDKVTVNMRDGNAKKHEANGDKAYQKALKTKSRDELTKAKDEYGQAISQYRMLGPAHAAEFKDKVQALRDKIAKIDQILKPKTSGARLLAATPLPAGTLIGFLGRSGDAALRTRIEETLSNAAADGVSYQIFESPAEAARFRDASGRAVSLVVDGFAIDTLDTQAEVIRAIRRLNDARLEAVYGALTKLVVLVATKDFYGTNEAEYRAALNGIIDAVKLPAAEAASLQFIPSQGRAVLWNAETAGRMADTLTAAAERNDAALVPLRDLLKAASDAMQTPESAESIASQMAGEPKFWQAAFGIDQQAVLTYSSDAKGGIVFTLKQYQKDKARFEETIAQGLFASIVMTEEERTSAAGIDATMEIEESRILFVKDRNLSTIQAQYAQLARTQAIPEAFVLMASEDELGEGSVHVDKDASLTGDSKAVVLVVEAQAASARGSVEAARILLGDWQDKGVLPEFLQSKGRGIFMFLPKVAPIKLAAWMAVVKKQMTSVGAAA